MTVVVDASVALKWVVPEPGSIAAAALRTAPELVAPAIWISEAANGLWKYVRRRELDPAGAAVRLQRLRDAPLASIAIEMDIESALNLAVDLNHPIYDCLYLALALRTDSHVVTADRRFVDLGGRRADLAGQIRALA